MRRWLGLGALAAAVLMLLLTIVWVVRQPRGEAPQEPAPSAPEQAADTSLEASGGEVVHRDANGQVVWTARFGGTITVDEKQRRLRHTNVVWEMARGGLPDLSLRAPVMEADYNARLLTFSDGVQVQAYGGKARFDAQRMRFEFDTGKLIGEGKVSFSYGGFTLTGTRLVIDNRSRKVRVSNGSLRLN